MATEKRLIDAMQLVTKLSKIVLGVKSARKVYDEVLRCIAEASTVDAVEVVHGRWNDHEGDPMWQKCSACGYIIQYSYSKDCKYCPNCGASMRDGDGDG